MTRRKQGIQYADKIPFIVLQNKVFSIDDFDLWLEKHSCTLKINFVHHHHHRHHHSPFFHPHPPHYYKYITSSRRYCSSSSSSSTTQYTIDEEGVDPDILERTVRKHCNNLSRYLKEKPIAAHTREAFMVLKNDLLKRQEEIDEGNDNNNTLPIIFDSGCGTGKSTLLLGQIYPNHTIIGIDRSLSRLTKNGLYREQQQQEEEEESSSKDGENNNKNVFLIRAELADFWRLWLEEVSSPSSSTTSTTKRRLNLPEKHFLLYPNPYPKRRRYQNRWYCHPSFPLLCNKLASEEIIIRSNWKEYLQDFETSIEIANNIINNNQEEEEESSIVVKYKSNDINRVDPSKQAWTNFEQKYFDVGENCYELRLLKK